jgi:hypothetical protein
VTINEMHIAVNLGVQKIASFQVDNFLPQEVDHELNSAMDRFIKQRYYPLGNKYRKGFEQSQKRIDDLRNLVSTNISNTFLLDGIELTTNALTEGYFADIIALPNDYLFLVNLRAEVLDACHPTTFNTVSETFAYQQISLTPPITGYYLTTVQIQLLSNNPITVIQNNSGVTYDQLLDSNNYTNNCCAPTLSIETSTEGNTVELTPTTDGNEIYLKINTELWDGPLVTTLTWSNGSETEIVTMQEYQTHTVRRRTTTNPNLIRRVVVCGYSQLDDIYTLLQDPFNTTTSTGPKYTLGENFVKIYTTNEFIVPSATVTYIRRPQRMNRIIGVGCELPEHTHQEIVEMAIKSILEGIQDPRYQSQSMENMESE